MWQQMDNKGTTESTTQVKTKLFFGELIFFPQLKSRHKNSILEVRPCRAGFSTCGADGQIIHWNANQLASKMANLQI